MIRLPWLPALMLFVIGCDDGTSARPVDGGADGAGADARIAIDPSLFDCTSLGPSGTGVPDRASVIPVACALDPLCRAPQISGHRGVGGTLGVLAPEDTLAAYRAGIALGIEFVETDPRPTRDGVLINLHDTTVDRTTDGRGAASAMTLAEIQALRVESDGMKGDFSCERIPTLVEVLATCKGKVVVLVDANKTDRVDLLVKAIQDADARDWAVFDTSSIDKLDRALAIDPNLHIMIRPSTVSEITAQLDHFAAHPPVIVELKDSERVEGSKVIHARGGRVLSDVFLEDAAAKLQGNLSGYKTALDSGVDILQSDIPELPLQALRELGLR